ncbi:hypothetical protein K461DRAFT_281564 [Myriangium duriaei CBS 260.36]|uniref:Uncharacterized protein n=1 Tax=Myriangium duriaei CBS 260.36 TaxID=1168546 RepID=A0A9P4ISI4_9PEZI|nr:hypothetical protein K461DRAFT_281564 [Myriangium duriaei CBS 260.36]
MKVSFLFFHNNLQALHIGKAVSTCHPLPHDQRSVSKIGCPLTFRSALIHVAKQGHWEVVSARHI